MPEPRLTPIDLEYRDFCREWKCNRNTPTPSVAEWKRWFRVKYFNNNNYKTYDSTKMERREKRIRAV